MFGLFKKKKVAKAPTETVVQQEGFKMHANPPIGLTIERMKARLKRLEAAAKLQKNPAKKARMEETCAHLRTMIFMRTKR